MILSDNIEKRRRQVEGIASFGLIFIAVSLVAPFAGMDDIRNLSFLKWIYAAGALIYIVARIVNVNDSKDSLRLRRLRRQEFWAGVAFCFAAFFWFYNDMKYLPATPGVIIMVGPLKILHETILFSLVGAFLQLVTSWMISFRMKKEKKEGVQPDKGANNNR
ncbi:MAG: hypothetical protein K2N03_08820 [Muribaculaceae bacterium]|nr:hypothetical protein [Muribaculaceae bacterium]